MNKDKAVIFDMDGVIVDNSEYHYRAWEIFCEKEGYTYSREGARYWFGGTNQDILEKVYKRKVDREEAREKGAIKEKLYRDLIAPELRPVPGIRNLLNNLREAGVSLAVATSAPGENVDFILDRLDLRSFFDHIVDADGVKRGKPDPEIYLKAADILKVHPQNCLVFEDAVHGIQAAREAGMQVVGLITTLEDQELQGTLFNIRDFTKIKAEKLIEIINKQATSL